MTTKQTTANIDIETESQPAASPSTSFPNRAATLKDFNVPVARVSKAAPGSDVERLKYECNSLAISARDAFKEACEAVDPSQAEASFFAAKDKLECLWNYAHLRNEPFQNLLGLLDAAIKRIELKDLEVTQKDTLRTAFADLQKYYLQQTDVGKHIDAFAENRIDIMSPLVNNSKRPLRITIREVD